MQTKRWCKGILGASSSLFGQACKEATMRRAAGSCSGYNSPTIKLVTEKKIKSKRWSFGFGYKEKVDYPRMREYMFFYNVARHVRLRAS